MVFALISTSFTDDEMKLNMSYLKENVKKVIEEFTDVFPASRLTPYAKPVECKEVRAEALPNPASVCNFSSN